MVRWINMHAVYNYYTTFDSKHFQYGDYNSSIGCSEYFLEILWILASRAPLCFMHAWSGTHLPWHAVLAMIHIWIHLFDSRRGRYSVEDRIWWNRYVYKLYSPRRRHTNPLWPTHIVPRLRSWIWIYAFDKLVTTERIFRKASLMSGSERGIQRDERVRQGHTVLGFILH